MKRAAIHYSAAEMQWLADNRMMVISDYHRGFVAAFGRSDVSAMNLHGLRKRKGWKVGRESSRYAGRHWKFSPAEIAWLGANCTLPLADLHRGFCAEFRREDITKSALHSMRKRMGWKTGRTGQFGKGSVSWNQGKKLGNNPGSARTQFRKGQIPHTARGAGHESTDDNGYVWLIVDAPNPHTGAATRRVQKHKWLWEREHGPVPKGCVLKCLDGNKANTSPANWEAVPTGLLPRLNGKSGRNYDRAPAELKPTIMAVAKLEHQVRAAEASR